MNKILAKMNAGDFIEIIIDCSIVRKYPGRVYKVEDVYQSEHGEMIRILITPTMGLWISIKKCMTVDEIRTRTINSIING